MRQVKVFEDVHAVTLEMEDELWHFSQPDVSVPEERQRGLGRWCCNNVEQGQAMNKVCTEKVY